MSRVVGEASNCEVTVSKRIVKCSHEHEGRLTKTVPGLLSGQGSQLDA